MTITLGYWNARGLGGQLRILLHYLEVNFVDKTYSMTDGLSKWKEDKEKYIKDEIFLFPNLPYLIDDDVAITQSLAILRYLGRKYALWPSEQQQVRADQLEQELVDLRFSVTRVVYDRPNYHKSRAEWLEASKIKLQQLDKVIGSGPWALGDKISYIDFLLYDALDFVRLFGPQQLDSFSNLQHFIDRFEELPTVKAYIRSPNYKPVPIAGPMAVWDGVKVVPDEP